MKSRVISPQVQSLAKSRCKSERPAAGKDVRSRRAAIDFHPGHNEALLLAIPEGPQRRTRTDAPTSIRYHNPTAWVAAVGRAVASAVMLSVW
jgi:hypothetical protein